jgi:hypothetical protein
MFSAACFLIVTDDCILIFICCNCKTFLTLAPSTCNGHAGGFCNIANLIHSIYRSLTIDGISSSATIHEAQCIATYNLWAYGGAGNMYGPHIYVTNVSSSKDSLMSVAHTLRCTRVSSMSSKLHSEIFRGHSSISPEFVFFVLS